MNFKWAKQMGDGGDWDHVFSVVTDAAGNVFTTGQFDGTVDFDPGPGTYYLTSWSVDMFISKLDPNGNLVWVKQMGDPNGVHFIGGYSMALDASGNVYTTGLFEGTIDFDPGAATYYLTSASGPTGGDMFVSKLDAAGNFVWVKQMGGNTAQDICVGTSIALDASGNIYTKGDFKGVIDFDPGTGTSILNSLGLTNIFVSKLDASGNFVWAKQIGGNVSQYVYAQGGKTIALDALGNVYFVGEFKGTVDFDPGPGVYNLTSAFPLNWWAEDVYVSKLDPNGNFVWAKQMAGTVNVSGSWGTGIALDDSANVYTTGSIDGTVDFDPGPCIYNLSTPNIVGIFISKLDVNGNFVWAKQMGEQNGSFGEGISLDAVGNVYTTGSFWGLADFDPGPGTHYLTANFEDAFISKLNPDGNFIWARQMPGINNVSRSYGSSIALDPSANIYTVGQFMDTVDFDPDITSYNLTAVGTFDNFGSGDMFIHKIGQCTNSTSSTLTITDCKNYILNGHTYTTSGIYTQVISNTAGCDSIITLNLTINRIYADKYVNTCGPYTWHCHTYNTCNTTTTQCITYTSSGVYMDTVITANACDSIITLHLTIDTATSSTVAQTICDGQTYNGHGISGTYIDTFHTTNGCDSIVTLNLTVLPRSFTAVSKSICTGQSYNGHNTTGTYKDTLIAANGCDSIVTLILTVLPKSFSTITRSICIGQSYNGHNTSGTYKDTLIAANGCDSVVTLTLTVLPKSFSTIVKSICTGQSYNGHSTSGTYIDTLIAANGCDSVRTLQLTVLPGSFTTISKSICTGQSYEGHTSSGIYVTTLVATNGCDSIITLQLSVLPIPAPYLGADTSICIGKSIKLYPGSFDTYTWQDGSVQSYFIAKQAGVYSVVVTNGCGSVNDAIVIKEGICDIYFPAAFTPNNDGKNDEFKILGAQNINDYHLLIYNRYGQKIFETSKLTEGWTGKYKGKLQETGVYVWQCNFTRSGFANNMIGTVILLK